MVQRKIEVIIMPNGITVKCGSYGGENNVVDKTSLISWNSGSPSCEMLNTDMINPSIKLTANYKLCNYVYIADFRRYYFVSRCETLPGGHCILHCHVDVLMTYKGDILGSTQFIHRNESDNLWNRELTDNLFPITGKKVTKGIDSHVEVTSPTSIFSSFIVGIV